MTDTATLRGPAHAAAAIRLSAPPASGPAAVLVLCDSDHAVLLAVVVDGAGPENLSQILGLALAVAEPAGVAAVVLGVVRERLGPPLTAAEAAHLAGMEARCSEHGVDLLDVLVVGPRGWRSEHHHAGGGTHVADDLPPENDPAAINAGRARFDAGECQPTCLMSNEELVSPVGKKAAGRLLDGRTWDEMPAVRP